MRLASRQQIIDIAIPAIVSMWQVFAILGPEEGDPATLPLLGVVTGLVSGAALYWRRRYPLRVMAITLAGGVAAWALSPEILFPYAALFALFALTRQTSPLYSLPALAAVLGVTTLGFMSDALDEDVAFALAVAVVVWALAEASRTRKSALDEAARAAATEEQARIARELHDVVAHSVSVIVVQAAAAGDVFDRRPDQAREALAAIEASAREALAELRRLLEPVRQQGGEPLTAPQPGLDRLDDLVGPLQAAGLAVEVRREGEPRKLPPGVDLSAYRIVQEALTNTLRHAGATRADVVVSYTSDAVELTVTDDGRGDPRPATGRNGNGIPGMRERAALVGGMIAVGERGDGAAGFRVRARLPFEDPR